MTGPYLILVLFAAIAFIVVATSKYKIHPFIVLLMAAYLVAFATGMPAVDIGQTISQGFGGLMTQIGIVILLGTLIGVILEKSGAAIKLADLVLNVIGKKHPSLGLSIIGYIVSIPVFVDSAYIILSALKKSIIQSTGKSAVTMSLALATGLMATHVLVPPTPGSIAAAGNLGLENQLGLVIIFGLAIAIVPTLLGNVWANYIGKKYQCGEDKASSLADYEEVKKKYGKLPSSFKALAPIFIPILLIALASIINFSNNELEKSSFNSFLLFLGKPINALFIGFLFALRLMPAFNKTTLNDWIAEGIKTSAGIIMITGAGGAFGAVLKATPIGDYLGEVLSGLGLGIFLPFIIAAALKTAQGSSTVSLVTTSVLVAPLLAGLGLDSEMGRVLTVMAIGAGAMTVSHANDSFFWVFTQFSDMEVDVGYKTHTVATAILGVSTILTVFLLSLILL